MAAAGISRARLAGAVLAVLQLIVSILMAVSIGSLAWTVIDIQWLRPEVSTSASAHIEVGLLRSRPTVIQSLGFGTNRESAETVTSALCNAYAGALVLPGSSETVRASMITGSKCDGAVAAGRASFAFNITALLLNFIAAVGFGFFAVVADSYMPASPGKSAPALAIWATLTTVVGFAAAFILVAVISWGAGMYVPLQGVFGSGALAIGPHAAVAIASLILNLTSLCACCALWSGATRTAGAVAPAAAAYAVPEGKRARPPAAQ